MCRHVYLWIIQLLPLRGDKVLDPFEWPFLGQALNEERDKNHVRIDGSKVGNFSRTFDAFHDREEDSEPRKD